MSVLEYFRKLFFFSLKTFLGLLLLLYMELIALLKNWYIELLSLQTWNVNSFLAISNKFQHIVSWSTCIIPVKLLPYTVYYTVYDYEISSIVTTNYHNYYLPPNCIPSEELPLANFFVFYHKYIFLLHQWSKTRLITLLKGWGNMHDLCTWLISIIPTIVYMFFGTAIPTSLNNLKVHDKTCAHWQLKWKGMKVESPPEMNNRWNMPQGMSGRNVWVV